MMRSFVTSTTAAMLVLGSVVVGAAETFNPDPMGQYEVMKNVAGLSAAQQDAVFEQIMGGGNRCAPELYVETGTDGVLAVTVLSMCHAGQAVTLLCGGVSQDIQMSNNGAVLINLAGSQKTDRVQAVFADGSRVQAAVRGENTAYEMASYE